MHVIETILVTVLYLLLMLAEEPIVAVKIDLDVTQTKIDNAEGGTFLLLSPQSETELALVEQKVHDIETNTGTVD